jgi:cytidylate kinase
MAINVVTIEREFGSGAAAIAKRVADRLGFKLWDELLTSEIARLAQCKRSEVAAREERTDPLYYRLLKSFLRGSFEGSLNAYRLKLVDTDVIFRLTERIVKAAAEEGNCVIVGRGSAFFLENRPQSFHVFLYAPYAEKVRRLIESGNDPEEASRLVDTIDLERADFIKRYFGVEWPLRRLYDVMINSQMGDEAVVGMILNGIAGKGG